MPDTPTFAVPANFAIDPQKLADTRRALEAAGVEFCFSTYVDIHGVPKAKANPLAAFEKMAHGSELFTVGAMEGMGLIGPHEDECAAVPDLDTMLVCPWDRRHAYFFGDLYYHGAPYVNDSRVILKRQIERAAKLGLKLNLGMETEFYVLFVDPETGTRKLLQRDKYAGTCPAYDMHLTLGAMDFLAPMSRYMNELGWGLYSFDQEGGHSQFEFDFHYADALTTCDRFVFLRLMAKNVAQQIGATATFVPKPFADDFRSADHFNMSLASLETGANLFAPQPDGNEFATKYGLPFSKLAYHFAAGILRHAPAITAVTSPTYNSYQGLIAQGDMPDISWAPVMMAWGNNNRSAMLRFPPNRYCVENRTPDIACNPYLAAAVQLAAGLDGIEQQLDPGPPLNTNCYDLTRAQLREAGVELLPRTLLHALEAFERDPFIGDVFGAEFKGIYLKQKLREWDEGFYAINEAHLRKRLTFI
jgi:glutamine synthetase